nr:MAG TPA: hypothetical protein [Caudoviricetes sp.]
MSRTQIRRGIQHNIDLLFLFIGQFINLLRGFAPQFVVLIIEKSFVLRCNKI